MFYLGYFTFAVSVLLQNAICDDDGPLDVRKYYPELENDMTKVTWVHACNSRQKLEAALNSDVKMIEADVIAGHLTTGGGGAPIPVMGHPPETTSDISLEQFLDMVLSSKRHKGIKLDFKSVAIFKTSENFLEEFMNKAEVDFPVWVNADIIKGPGHPPQKEVVEANYFLHTCITKFPFATISAGWTVSSSEAQSLSYTGTHINEMTTALADNNVIYPVTFPVHAGIASNSVDIMTSLISTSPHGSSLTLWAGAGEWVDYGKLRKLIKDVGKDKVFVDMPQDMIDKLHQESPPNSRATHIAVSGAALLIIGLLFI